MVRFGVLLGCLVLMLGPTAAATAGTGHGRTQMANLQAPSRSLPSSAGEIVGPETTVPFGWEDFCRRYAGECESGPAGAARIELTSVNWKTVEEINRKVNHEIEPITDKDHWGVVDQWDLPIDGKGDCEDYALLKRKLLIAAGLPRQALLMTVVRDLQGEGHAVLTLVSDRGDIILDNMTDEIVAWRSTGYRFVKRQSQADPNVWMSLRGTDVPVVSTTR